MYTYQFQTALDKRDSPFGAFNIPKCSLARRKREQASPAPVPRYRAPLHLSSSYSRFVRTYETGPAPEELVVRYNALPTIWDIGRLYQVVSGPDIRNCRVVPISVMLSIAHPPTATPCTPMLPVCCLSSLVYLDTGPLKGLDG